MRSRLLLIAAVFLASCAAHGDLFRKVEPPAPGQAVLYVFRTQYVPRSMDLAPGITVNGKEVGALPLDGYLRIEVPPGSTEVRLNNRAYLWPAGAPLRSLRVEAQPGETYYVEFSVEKYQYVAGSVRNTTYLGVDLRQVNEEAAMRFLPKLKNAN